MSAWEITKKALKVLGGAAFLGGLIWINKSGSDLDDDLDDELRDYINHKRMMWYMMSEEERAENCPY